MIAREPKVFIEMAATIHQPLISPARIQQRRACRTIGHFGNPAVSMVKLKLLCKYEEMDGWRETKRVSNLWVDNTILLPSNGNPIYSDIGQTFPQKRSKTIFVVTGSCNSILPEEIAEKKDGWKERGNLVTQCGKLVKDVGGKGWTNDYHQKAKQYATTKSVFDQKRWTTQKQVRTKFRTWLKPEILAPKSERELTLPECSKFSSKSLNLG